jgi:hypothetical protein
MASLSQQRSGASRFLSAIGRGISYCIASFLCDVGSIAADVGDFIIEHSVKIGFAVMCAAVIAGMSSANAGDFLVVQHGQDTREIYGAFSQLGTAGADGEAFIAGDEVVPAMTAPGPRDRLFADAFEYRGAYGEWHIRMQTRDGVDETHETCRGNLDYHPASGGDGALLWLECRP